MINNVNIVCSHKFRESVEKNSNNYVMDLGKRYTEKTDQNTRLDIQDKFVNDFLKDNGELVYKSGRIGTINFYTWSALQNEDIILYGDNEKLRHTCDLLEVKENPEKFLAKVIYELEQIKKDSQ